VESGKKKGKRRGKGKGKRKQKGKGKGKRKGRGKGKEWGRREGVEGEIRISKTLSEYVFLTPSSKSRPCLLPHLPHPHTAERRYTLPATPPQSETQLYTTFHTPRKGKGKGEKEKVREKGEKEGRGRLR
jgi:hypothetical protein